MTVNQSINKAGPLTDSKSFLQNKLKGEEGQRCQFICVGGGKMRGFPLKAFIFSFSMKQDY